MILPNPETETLTLTVPAGVAEQLRRAAERRGEPLDSYLRHVTEREAAEASKIDEWVARWEAWANSRPARAVNVDDSRESIYEGCGE